MASGSTEAARALSGGVTMPRIGRPMPASSVNRIFFSLHTSILGVAATEVGLRATPVRERGEEKVGCFGTSV